jgi:glucose-6-phosphate-specific signal transduction histidine kinase
MSRQSDRSKKQPDCWLPSLLRPTMPFVSKSEWCHYELEQGAERLFGYTAQEAIGQHITLIIPRNRLNEEHEKKQSDQLRELSRRLLCTQEEERRHIARELLDSAGQGLTVLGLSVNHLVQ